MGFEEASPIQAKSIKPLLEGKDIIGQAQTGTGKTAAFGIPILEMVDKGDDIQAIVLCPTRELSLQISKEIGALAKYKKGIKILPVYGGTNIDRQMRNIRKKVQVIVGTPGRVMDLMRRKAIKLDKLKIAVLDEADEMFAMGFRDDMKTILDQTNDDRITCFYSATMGKDIMNFSNMYQNNPEIIKIQHKEVTVENISQYYLEMAKNMKKEILSRLIDIYSPKLSIVFCNTKRMVDELVSELSDRGYVADGLHGDLKQSQRDNVMKKFRDNTIDILVATDVAARGIDVGNVDIVFNYDLPQDEEYYVHRIGRTARAGRKGKAFTFIIGRDIYKLDEIIKYTKARIDYLELPTIDEMDKTRKNKVLDDLIVELSKEHDLKNERVLLDRLLQNGYGAVEIAANLLKILGDKNTEKKHERLEQVDYGVTYSFDKNSTKKVKSGRKASRARGSRIFINKGKRDGLTPEIILAAMHKEADLPRELVGNIIIKPNFTFVELPERYLEQAVRGLFNKKIRGKRVEVEISNRG
ncbi:MAG: DEAD/DEAH box helicase [Tissierellia bacterium]|nr:DEAD/DEAH box helicase [Tissierellia bacterium]